MAAELKQAFGAQVKLVEGSGGVFDVTVDGKRVYSKHETGRFPDEGEVVELIQKSSQATYPPLPSM